MFSIARSYVEVRNGKCRVKKLQRSSFRSPKGLSRALSQVKLNELSDSVEDLAGRAPRKCGCAFDVSDVAQVELRAWYVALVGGGTAPRQRRNMLSFTGFRRIWAVSGHGKVPVSLGNMPKWHVPFIFLECCMHLRACARPI